jgi:hypothetical protein
LAAVENFVGFLAERPSAIQQLTSEQHDKLAAAYANPGPNSSLEDALRWRRFSRYHAALSKAALKRELLKANPRQSPAPNPSDEGQLAFGF